MAVLVWTGPGFSRKAHLCTLTLEVLSTSRLYYSGEIVKDNYYLRVLMRDERFPAHVFADVNSPGRGLHGFYITAEINQILHLAGQFYIPAILTGLENCRKK